MDPNLTYPTILSGSINATLISEPSSLIKDSLPTILSIGAVIVGAIATLGVNNWLEKNKRQYELKKQAYLRGIELVTETELLYSRLRTLVDKSKINPIPGEDPLVFFDRVKAALPKSDRFALEKSNEKSIQNTILIYTLSFKIRMIGNNKVIDAFKEVSNAALNVEQMSISWDKYIENVRKFNELTNALSDAIKEDLG